MYYFLFLNYFYFIFINYGLVKIKNKKSIIIVSKKVYIVNNNCCEVCNSMVDIELYILFVQSVSRIMERNFKMDFTLENFLEYFCFNFIPCIRT